MGIHDLSTSIEYIANVTNKQGEIIYIGHSMGTTMFFVYASVLKSSSKYIKAMVALAPCAFLKNIESPIRLIAPWIDEIEVKI